MSAFGKLSSAAPSCVGGKTVVLKTSDGATVAKTRTKPHGGYSFSGRPRRSVTVRVVFFGTAKCAAVSSTPLRVAVR